MRLGIISDCVRYKTPDGKVGTETHILLRQLEALSAYFTEAIICCPFAGTTEGKALSFYTRSTIYFIEVPVVGGDTLKDKLKIATVIPKWLSAFKKVDAVSDIVYQRFPNNLNIPDFFISISIKRGVFGTYTGTWAGYKSEPKTYKFQRWLLKKHFRGPVWAYTVQDCKKVLSGFSPSYTIAEWNQETEQVQTRLHKIQEEGIDKFRMITVGSLIGYKNQLTILKACSILKTNNFSFYLTIVGSGPMMKDLQEYIVNNQLSNDVQLVGHKNPVQLRELYRQHNFIVQAPLSEGFGKVPVEGFFHGLLPVISDISMAKHITGNGERGFLFDTTNPQNLADTLASVRSKISELPAMIEKGREFAKTQTLDAWAENYYKTVLRYFEEA